MGYSSAPSLVDRLVLQSLSFIQFNHTQLHQSDSSNSNSANSEQGLPAEEDPSYPRGVAQPIFAKAFSASFITHRILSSDLHRYSLSFTPLEPPFPESDPGPVSIKSQSVPFPPGPPSNSRGSTESQALGAAELLLAVADLCSGIGS